MADLGYRFYKESVNGEDYYQVGPNLGNTPGGQTSITQQEYSNAEKGLRASNPTRWNAYFDDQNRRNANAFTGGGSGYEMKDGVPWQTTAIQQEQANASNPNMQAVQVGGGTAYIPKTGAGGQPTPAMQNMPNIGTNNTANAANAKYQQALAQTKATGAPAPTTMGGASSTIQGTVPPEAPDMSIVDSMLMEDKGFQDLQKTYSEYFHPETQKTTLMDTYNKLYKDAGLEKLDTEILDAKTIIEGTEDDIRNEIQQAGGFGTDSQVQALSLARNKSLLKNYNNLVAMRESKTNNLNTMMNLAEKDRAYADQQVDRMFNFDVQMQEYRNKFIQNTLDQYNKYEPAQLYAMLEGNPRQLAFAEQIMGVGPGGLQKLATMPGAQDLMEISPGATLYDKTTGKAVYTAPTAKSQSVGTSSGGGVSSVTNKSTGFTDANGKPIKLTATQVDSLTGFDNARTGAQKAQTLLDTGVKTGPGEKIKLSLAKLVNRADSDQLDLEQTLAKIKADFMKSISGAAVSESEAKRLASFLPEFGDQEGVIKSKLKNLIEESTKSKNNYLKTLGASAGGNLVVGPDGNEYEIIN